VLPTPGYDIEYPDNDIGDFYREFMASERGGGLDPADMRRLQKDFSLSGSYRKILAQVGKDLSFEVKTYHEENEQLVETDLEKLLKSRPQRQKDGPNNHQNGRQRNARAEQVVQEKATLFGTPQHNAWLSLPEQLAAEGKAQAAALAAQKLVKKSVDEDIKQPSYKETFIEVSPEEGQRTGNRTTTIIPGTAVVAEDVVIPESTTMSAPDKAEIPADSKFSGESTKKRLAEEISTSTPLEAPNSTTSTTETTTLEAPNGAVSTTERPAQIEEQKPAKIAVIVKFALGSSQYATMALRELMKAGGAKTYKPNFSSGR